MIYLFVICFMVWLYLLSVLKRGKLDYWFYIVGSVGTFVFLLVLLEPVLTGPLTDGVALVAGFLGELTGFYTSYFQYGALLINSKNSSISLYIDYECSGVIEILAFTAMLWYYKVYHLYEKVIVNIIGFLWIFLSNVIRIFVICTLTYYYGNDIFFFANTVFGRLIFYGLSVILYFQVFTRSQIVRQKIGSFYYENN